MKTKVYWAYAKGNPMDQLTGYPPERMLSVLKNDPLFRDTIASRILLCPAFLNKIKNTYVIRSPLDLEIIRRGEDLFEIFPTTVEVNSRHVQLHDIIEYIFFSDNSVLMTATPPFLHPDSAPGVLGEYNIGKWYRSMGPTVLMEGKDTYSIHRGQPLLYLSFDTKVDLIQYHMTEKLYRISNSTSGLQNILPRQPLQSLYQMFQRNKMRSTIMREIKENIL